MANILVAYYSHSGNTKQVAGMIAQETGGLLHFIEPAAPYPVDYNTVVHQAKKEVKAGYKPELMNHRLDLAAYNAIFVGSPNWWSTIAPPVATFLSGCNCKGKTINPFCTHGGGGQGNCQSDIVKLCPGANVLECLSLYGNGGASAKKAVLDWLQKIGI